jgi:hypothetical protein
MTILFDESPGILREIRDAYEANCAGGAPGQSKIVACGNPTDKNTWFGEIFDSPHWHPETTASTSTINCRLGRVVVPGLATREFCEREREEYGEDHPNYMADVLAEFPTRAFNRLVTDLEYSEAVNRVADEGGDFVFGIDPAYGGLGGDSSVIAMRRGRRIVLIHAFKGGVDRVIHELRGLIAKHRRHAHEPVTINFDSSAGIGADLHHALRNLRNEDDCIRVVPLESRGDARNDPLLRGAGVDRPRDAYYLGLAAQIKRDLQLPFDEQLREELLAAEWQQDRDRGSRLIEKKEFRKRLGRSPDRCDAVAYAAWDGKLPSLSNASVPQPRREENIGTSLEDPRLARQRSRGLEDVYRQRDEVERQMPPYAEFGVPETGAYDGDDD